MGQENASRFQAGALAWEGRDRMRHPFRTFCRSTQLLLARLCAVLVNAMETVKMFLVGQQ